MDSKIIGEFELLSDKLIGKGAWGEVYHGRQKSLNRPVAIKILKKELTTDPDFVTRFRREAECLAKMADEHIIQVYSAGEYEGSYYFIMEYVQGKPLSTFIERGRKFTVNEIAHIAESVAKALKTAWDSPAKIVHRDIKPSNIMVSYTSSLIAPLTKTDVSESLAAMDINITEAKVKVMDFGLAKLSEGDKEATIVGTVIGTPKYISPEQGMGKAADIRSDIYSLGIVMYEMATGNIPFEAESALSMIRHHIYDTAVAPSQYNQAFPKELETIIMKCIQKDPARRYANPTQLLEDLTAFKHKQPPVHASRAVLEATMISDIIRKKKRNKFIYAGLAGAVLLGGLLAFRFFKLTPPEPITNNNSSNLLPVNSSPVTSTLISSPQTDLLQEELKNLLVEADQLVTAGKLEEAEQKTSEIMKKSPQFEPARLKLDEIREKITADEYRRLGEALLADEWQVISPTGRTQETILFNRIIDFIKTGNFSQAKNFTEKLIDARKDFSPAAYYFLMRLLNKEKGPNYLGNIELKLEESATFYRNSHPEILAKSEKLLETIKLEYAAELYQKLLKEVEAAEKLEDKVNLLNQYIRLNPAGLHRPGAENLIAAYQAQIAEKRLKTYQSLLEELKNSTARDYGEYRSIQQKITELSKTYTEFAGELSEVMKTIENKYFNVLGITPLDEERDKETGLPLRITCITDSAVMVLIPGGEFTRGAELLTNEKPARRVYLSPFYIDKYEVNNRQFQKFLEETGYKTDAESVGKGYVYSSENYIVENACWKDPQGNAQGMNDRLDHPVVQTSWADADRYSRWAGKQLPTEAQWEKSARGTKGQKYPWGEEWDAQKCNSVEKGPGKTVPVTDYENSTSPYGCFNMAGNVSEWCRDWYHPDYYRNSPPDNPPGPPEGLNRVIRGGSWEMPQDFLRCAKRTEGLPIEDLGGCWTDALGFRCVIEIR